VRLLLLDHHGGDARAPDCEGITPLAHVAENERYLAAPLLLCCRGVAVVARDCQVSTLLMRAAANKHASLVEPIL
jgi:hypothetical protein